MKQGTAKKSTGSKTAKTAATAATAVVRETTLAKQPAPQRVIKTILDYAREAEAQPVKTAVFKEPTNLPGDEELRPHAYAKSAGKSTKCAVCFNPANHELHSIVEEPAEEEPAAEKLTALAAKAGKKKPSAKVVELPKPPKDRPMIQAIRKAEFSFVMTQEVPGFGYAHGYQHKDGRGALYSHNVAGTEENWAIKLPAETPAPPPEAARLAGVKLIDLKLALMQTSKTALNKAAHRLARAAKAAELALEGTEGMTVADIASARATVLTKPAVNGVPANVVRAVEMLGGLTLQNYNLDLLRGDKYYGKRMALLKNLFNRDRVLAKECTIGNLTQAFYSAVGAEGKSAAARATTFADRCKTICAAIRKIKTANTRAERKLLEQALQSTKLDRTVPGKVLSVAKPLSNKERKAQEDAAKREIYALAVTPEVIAAPRPDAEVELVPGDIGLLQDPKNGLVMMQLERENSQGAICVYNNGVRVAVGVVPTKTLRNLRPVPGEVDLIAAANQLLNPMVPSVPVTPAAARHLTAVLHCKELIPMANETVTKTPKFAPPAKKSAAKSAKAEKAPKAKKAARESTRRTYADEMTIKLVTKTVEGRTDGNPYREGTKAFNSFAILRKSDTVGAFKKALEKAKSDVYEAVYFIKWASEPHGNAPAHIKLS